MHFTKLELHNFGVYRGTQELSLSDGIDGRNIILVGGLNGRGKTTLHDAILLALYGKQAMRYIQENVRSYDRLLLDRVNRQASDPETYVAVSLCLDDGTILRVQRAWRPHGQRADARVLVEKNGVVDPYLGENWSYYIEEILPFSVARFFFFNSEKIVQLADDASCALLRRSIRSAIGVETIDRALEHVDAVIHRKKRSLAAFAQSPELADCRELEAQLAETDQRLAEALRQAQAAEQRCKALSGALEDRERSFWASGGHLGRTQEAIQLDMQRASDGLERAREEALQLALDPATPLLMCRDLVSQAYSDECAARQSAAQRYADALVGDLHRQACDRLGRSGLGAAEMQLVQRILDDVLTGRTPSSGVQASPGALSAAGMMLCERLLAEGFASIPQRIRSLSERIGEKRDELQRLDAHLLSDGAQAQARQRFEALKSAEAEKALADAECARQRESVDRLEKRREMLKAQRLQRIRAIADREQANGDDARILRYAAMSMDVLRQFRSRLQCAKVAQLSGTVTSCFRELVGKDSLAREIRIHPDTLDVTILDPDGNELSRRQLSAGEQQMFAVAVIWALALNSGYRAPVVIDTPMARLDSAHRASFLTRYLPKASSQVLLLSTDEEVCGRYLDLVRDHVAASHTLSYSDVSRCTTIEQGYFEEV